MKLFSKSQKKPLSNPEKLVGKELQIGTKDRKGTTKNYQTLGIVTEIIVATEPRAKFSSIRADLLTPDGNKCWVFIASNSANYYRFV